ncbi:MAG: hypothetical protein NZM42_07335 [Gemmatales bacterium]|nr:hypothetical protein [Gemmatales bacterium]
MPHPLPLQDNQGKSEFLQVNCQLTPASPRRYPHVRSPAPYDLTEPDNVHGSRRRKLRLPPPELSRP